MKSQRMSSILVLAGAAGAIALGCNGASESVWSCSDTNVPMGTALECVSTNASSTLTYEEYDCIPADDDDYCPPPDGSGTRDGVPSDGTGGGSSSDGVAPAAARPGRWLR